MTLTTMIAELEEAERAVKAAKDKYDDSLVHDDWERYEAALKAQATLMRNSLPTLIEAVKRQGEAKGTPIWGVWVDYNLAPPGSYACLVSSFVNGEWSDPEARWMPAQGRPALQGQIRIMPHLMPNDPLTAHKETTDV